MGITVLVCFILFHWIWCMYIYIYIYIYIYKPNIYIYIYIYIYGLIIFFLCFMILCFFEMGQESPCMSIGYFFLCNYVLDMCPFQIMSSLVTLLSQAESESEAQRRHALPQRFLVLLCECRCWTVGCWPKPCLEYIEENLESWAPFEVQRKSMACRILECISACMYLCMYFHIRTHVVTGSLYARLLWCISGGLQQTSVACYLQSIARVDASLLIVKIWNWIN